MADVSPSALRAAIEEVVYAGCLALDESAFSAFLELASDDLRYRITAYSPEIRKDMTWLDHDRNGLVALFELLPKHHVNHADWHRQAVVYTIARTGPTEARAVTSLVVHHTLRDVGDSHVHGGSTSLFAVGRYHDHFRFEQGRWLLTERTVRLETRQLGVGSHLIV